MTPEQLKASILQHAMEGKLVEQLKEDGNAEDLFRSISEQKKTLIQTGKIKKTKPMDVISEEEIPFDIPDNWKWVRLLELCEIIGDIDHKMPKTVDKGQGYPFLSAKDINDDYSLNFSSNVKYISKEDFDRLRVKTQPKKNDIIFSRIGSLGKIGVVEDDIDFLVSYSCCVIRPLSVNLHYLKFFLEGPQIQYHIRRAKTGIGVPDLGMAMIKGIPVPLPPIEEQHRIVAKIEELLPLVDRYAKSYEKLEHFNAKFPEEMKKSILQYAIQGKLVEQRTEEGTAEELYDQIQSEKQKLIKAGRIKKEKSLPEISEDEIPFDIPESWKWVRWGDLSQSIQYGYNAPAAESGVIRMVRISDIQNEKVEWDNVPYCDIDKNEIEKYKLKENDILFARTGGTVGKSYIVENIPEDSIYAGYLIRSTYSEKLCPKYLKFFMGSQLYWNQLRDGVSAVAQPNCNGKKLAKMILPLPPLEEQHRIVAKIEELLPYCDRLSR